MKLFIKTAVSLALVGISSTTYAAGDLVVGATIKQIALSGSSTDLNYFTVVINGGGTGPCNADGTAIRFPKSVNDADAAEQMYSTVLAAYLAGKKVRFHSYQAGTDCEKAQFVRISD